MIRAHTGAIRSLAVVELDEQQRARLARFGLGLRPRGEMPTVPITGRHIQHLYSGKDTITLC